VSLRLGLGMVIDLCVCVCDKEGSRVCVRERYSVYWLSVALGVSLCLKLIAVTDLYVRGGEHTCVCVCMCVRGRKRERERESVCVCSCMSPEHTHCVCVAERTCPVCERESVCE